MKWYLLATLCWIVAMQIVCKLTSDRCAENGWFNGYNQEQMKEDQDRLFWTTLILCFVPIIRWVIFGSILYMATHPADHDA